MTPGYSLRRTGLVLERPQYAGVAELADAHDSNSCELSSCGFESHLRHCFWRFLRLESRLKSIAKPCRWLAIEDGVIITFFIVMC